MIMDKFTFSWTFFMDKFSHRLIFENLVSPLDLLWMFYYIISIIWTKKKYLMANNVCIIAITGRRMNLFDYSNLVWKQRADKSAKNRERKKEINPSRLQKKSCNGQTEWRTVNRIYNSSEKTNQWNRKLTIVIGLFPLCACHSSWILW